ncbi:MAG: phosphoglucosamine mutase [Dictyoglomus sp.]|nr:phosphoglucosamine mutase [Dictyoglomus sp.]MCX7941814.1 phosphoglucosamine mutase [Dictyoglomaceae bacterium]MDW8188083.1 phosphoglucosamine mutase [Dictyoglomus sp.]
MNRIFGTDGIRGKVNEDLTPEFILKLGKVLAEYLEEKGKIIIGYDTRISRDMLNFALQSGILSMGIDTLDVGIIPTPGIAYLVRCLEHISAGIVISASHNPVEYNGIKIFGKDGFKLPDNVEEEIENLLKSEAVLYRGKKIGKRIEFPEGKNLYIKFLKEVINLDLRGWKIFLDCANGSVSEIAPILYKDLGAEVVAINYNYDGTNINKNCGAVYPQIGLENFKNSGATIGFTFDGDGDRVLAFSEKFSIVNGDKILGIIALYLKRKKKLNKNTVVGTIMTNLGLEEFLKGQDISLIRTKVGDRYILEEILNNKLNLGGEPSGHVILFDYLPTGDGLLASLFLLKILKEENISLEELANSIPQYPQITENLNLNKNYPKEITKTLEELVKEVIRENNIRSIVRFSGTESSVLRITLEGDVPESLLEEYMKKIKNKIISFLN